MDSRPEIRHLKKCLELIEAKMNSGVGKEWSGYDFEKLSAEIQQATGVLLSITTLKRLWGRLRYDNMPTATTLNALAKFAGYDDWSGFKHQHETVGQALAADTLEAAKTKREKFRPKVLPLLLFLLFAITCSVLLMKTEAEAPLKNSDFKFGSSKAVTEGVPNSVVFNYDASKAGKAPVFISQSWDLSRKVQVPKDDKAYSAIYYSPGYFRAKLIVGKKVVKEHDLMISSGGWMAMVYKDKGVPLYFKKEEVLKKDSIQVDQALLAKYNVSLQPSLPELRFYNVRETTGLKSDDFTFETTVRSGYGEGTAACRGIQVLVLCKASAIIVPLSSKGCTGDLSLYAQGVDVQSKSADLSGFGCDLDKWTKLKIESKNGQMHFFVNGRRAYSLRYSQAGSDIVGLQYRFGGLGAVKDTRFVKNNVENRF